MTTIRAATLAVSVLVVSACSKMDDSDGDISQSGSHNAFHAAASGGAMHLEAAGKGWHLTPYKCDDAEHAMSMCGDGEPTHAARFQTPAWLRVGPTTGMPRSHRMR